MKFLKGGVALLLVLFRPAVAEAQTPGPTLRMGGHVQVRERYQSGPGLTATLNQARLQADVTIPEGFGARVLVEYQALSRGAATAQVSLRDAYLRYVRGRFGVTAGQFKTPFSREFLVAEHMPAADDSLARDIPSGRSNYSITLKTVSIDRLDYRFGIMAPARNDERGLRKPIAGIESGPPKAARAEHTDERVQRFGAHRLRSGEGDSPTPKIESLEL